MPFATLRLAEPILRAVAAEGYSTPTPIQKKAIPHILEGKDLLGCAQTGTGKTAAFALPILHRLHANSHGPGSKPHAAQSSDAQPLKHHTARHPSHAPHHPHHAQPGKPRVLVLSPTRELALQIGDSFQTYGRHTGLRHTVIFGGVGQGPQVSALKRGVDILVATPGRLIDLLEQRHVDLATIEIFVLDEADRMLDMGFIAPIRRIVSMIPARRQTLMFSATMPPDIRRLAESILKDPVGVEVAPVATTAELVEQFVHFVDRRSKAALLTHVLRESSPRDRTLVFTRTKHGADKLVKELHREGIKADAIHGNKRQNIRQRTLENFRSGRVPVLIATDIAARGIDIDEIALVVNYDVPNVPETYVHRIGRTGRAGASGLAVAFCDHEERAYLRDIEKLIRRQIPVVRSGPEFTARAKARHMPEHVSPRGGHGSNARASIEARPVPPGPRHSARTESGSAHHSTGTHPPRRHANEDARAATRVPHTDASSHDRSQPARTSSNTSHRDQRGHQSSPAPQASRSRPAGGFKQNKPKPGHGGHHSSGGHAAKHGPALQARREHHRDGNKH